MHGTGQTASPSASVNYTVNYFDPDGVEAVIDYWDSVVLTPELRAQIAQNPRAQMYMDSLELSTFGAGGLFWGRTVADEFRARRGYDIAPVAAVPDPDRAHDGGHDGVPQRAAAPSTGSRSRRCGSTTSARSPISTSRTCCVRSRTSCTRTGSTLRAEISYGLPFELTRPGPEVDGIETESLEFGAQIDAYRLLAGPAHLFGKQYSSETGATTRNHILDHRFYDQIIATQLAAGITKTVLHGWASTAGAEGVTEWPGHEGMWPMFSERFDTRQPASGVLSAVERRDRPLPVRAPAGEAAHRRRASCAPTTSPTTCPGSPSSAPTASRIPDEEAYGRRWMRDRQNHWWQDLGMQDAGWTYEFFDGSLLLRDDVAFADGLVQPDGPGYQALIVYQSELDADVAAHLLGWARRGPEDRSSCTARARLEAAAGRRSTRRTSGPPPGPRAGRPRRRAGRHDGRAAARCRPSPRSTTRPGTVAALRGLGVRGRAEFAGDNRSVLTHLREDGDLLHLYAYHFLYETGETDAGRGRAARRAARRTAIDGWTGAIRPHRGRPRHDGDRTVVDRRPRPRRDRAAHPRPVGRRRRGLGAADAETVAELDRRGRRRRELGRRRAAGDHARTAGSAT